MKKYICENCSKEVKLNDSFCGHCGSKLLNDGSLQSKAITIKSIEKSLKPLGNNVEIIEGEIYLTKEFFTKKVIELLTKDRLSNVISEFEERESDVEPGEKIWVATIVG